MTKVDFYVLDTDSGQQSLLFTCKLIETFYREQRRVFIHTANKEEAERLDALLWTYSDTSFIPHAIYNPQKDFAPPIQIAHSNILERQTETLINLSQTIPAFYAQFKQIIEIIFSDPQIQQLGRERYRQYRDQGYEINTIKKRLP